MDIDIGADVFTANGEKVGTVDKVVADAKNWEVSDIVVRWNDWAGEDIIVSLSLVAIAQKDEVRLRVNRQQLTQMPHYQEADFSILPPGGYDELAYNPGNIVVPVKPPFPEPYPAPPPPPPLHDIAKEAPDQAFEIEEGTEVEAVDGTLGIVDDVLIDTYTDRITAILVRTNGLLGHDMTVPVEWIAEATTGKVRVAATMEQAKTLLGPPAGWYLSVTGRVRRRR